MNKTHRLIWNNARQSWIVAHEAASTGGQSATPKKHLLSAVAVALLASTVVAAPAVTTVPTGGQVVAGQATISQAANAVTIAQSTSKVILNWNSFDIGSQASVTFQQPSNSAVALNRVLGSAPSAIFGSLKANGQVFLINPNGVLFAQGARIDVSGLVASTLNIRNEDFLAGNYRFTRDGASGSIVNQGGLHGQYVALLAPEIRNQGVIAAHQGTVVLAAGDAVTLGITGNRLIDVQVDKASINTLIENKHLVQADQGTVILSAQSANSLIGQVVNTGAISAKGISTDGGTVRLLASSDIEHSGSIDVSAGKVGAGGTAILLADLANFASRTAVRGSIAARGGTQAGDGGFIETSASKVSIADGAQINARATLGKAGEWLIDPTDYTIAAAGGDMTGAALSATLGGGTNVVIQSTNGASGAGGDVFINDTVSWNAPAALTLNAQRSIEINAPISVLNGGGGLNLQFGQSDVESNIPAGNYLVKAPVNLAAGSTFATKYGSDGATTNYTVITSDAGLTTLSGALAGNYVIGANFSTLRTTPLGNFTGYLDGLGHAIDGLTITNDGTNPTNVGFFNSIGAAALVQNLGLTGVSIAGLSNVGALAGINEGTIVNVYSQGTVTGRDAAGANNDESVGAIGGLIGRNAATGLIGSSYSSATVSATTGVQAGGGTDGGIGGLVGVNDSGTIGDSYASGNVTGATDVGGLVGFANGIIQTSYSSGAVSGNTNVGGLVGQFGAGALLSTYWNTDTSSQMTSAADTGFLGSSSTGLTTDQAKQQSNWSGFDFNNTWIMYDGISYPLLRSMLTPLIVTAVDQNMTYTGKVFSGTNTAVYSSALPPNSTFTSSPNSPNLTFGGAWQAGRNAGTYAITPGGITLSNAAMVDPHGYLIRFVDGSLTIAPAPLIVTASNASKIYGQTPTLSAFTSSGLQNGETIGSVTQTSAGMAGTASVAGSPYAVVPSAATGGTFSAGNYVITYVNGSLTIAPAPLTVTASNASKIYGQTPTLSAFTSSGLQNGETIGSVTQTSAGMAGTASVAGSPYAVVPSAATGGTFSAGNYVITYVNGSLTITPVTVTATDQKSEKNEQQSLQGTSKPPVIGIPSTGASSKSGSSFIETPATTPTDTPKLATTAKERTNEILKAIEQKINAVVYGLGVAFSSSNISDADKREVDRKKKEIDEATAKAEIVLSGVSQDIQNSVGQLLNQQNLVNDLSEKHALADKEANAAKSVANAAAEKAALSAAAAVALAAQANADPTSIEKQIAANNAALQAQSDKGDARKTATAADKLTATATNAAADVLKASSTVTAIESKVTLQLSEADVVTAKQEVKNKVSAVANASVAVVFAKASVVAANEAVKALPTVVAKEAKAAEQLVVNKQNEAEAAKNKADKLQVEAKSAAGTAARLEESVKFSRELPEKAGIIAQMKHMHESAERLVSTVNERTGRLQRDVKGIEVRTKILKLGEQMGGIPYSSTNEDLATLKAKLVKVKEQMQQLVALASGEMPQKFKDDLSERALKAVGMAMDPNKLATVNAEGLAAAKAHLERQGKGTEQALEKANVAATAATAQAAAARAESDRLKEVANNATNAAPEEAKAAAAAAARRAVEAEAAAKTMADRVINLQGKVDQAKADIEDAKRAADRAQADSAAARIIVKKAEAEQAAADEVYRLKTIEVAKQAVTQRAAYAKETKAAATDARIKANKAAANTLVWQKTVDDKAKQIPLLTKAAVADAAAAAVLRAEADAAAVKWSTTDAAREKLKPAAEAADTKRLATEKALKDAEKELEALDFALTGSDALTLALSVATEIDKAGRKAAAKEKVDNAQSAYDTALADWETKQTEYNNLVVKANTESTAEQTAVSKFNQANAKAENSSTAQKLVEAQKVAAEKNVVTFTKYANAAAASASALETEASSSAKDAARDKP